MIKKLLAFLKKPLFVRKNDFQNNFYRFSPLFAKDIKDCAVMKKILNLTLILILVLTIFPTCKSIPKYSNGQVKYKGEKDNRKRKTGTWKFYYKNGRLQSTGLYQKNIKKGKWKFFYNNGKMQSTGSYNRNIKKAKWKFFYKNGKKKSEVFYTIGGNSYDSKSLLHGKCTYWKENGELLKVINYANGIKDGAYFEYYNNKVVVEGNYSKDEKIGSWKYYNSEGKITKTENYLNAKLHGIVTQIKGKRKTLSYYLEGEKVSKRKYNLALREKTALEKCEKQRDELPEVECSWSKRRLVYNIYNKKAYSFRAAKRIYTQVNRRKDKCENFKNKYEITCEWDEDKYLATYNGFKNYKTAFQKVKCENFDETEGISCNWNEKKKISTYIFNEKKFRSLKFAKRYAKKYGNTCAGIKYSYTILRENFKSDKSSSCQDAVDNLWSYGSCTTNSVKMMMECGAGLTGKFSSKSFHIFSKWARKCRRKYGDMIDIYCR